MGENETFQRIKQLEESAEKIGVIGSPSSSGKILVDILDSATSKKLIGSFCFFSFIQDGMPHVAFGQVTELYLRNRWTEDPIMKGLIRQKGNVEPITKRQDTHAATLNIGAVLSCGEKIQQSILGCIPSTGTMIKFASDELFDELFADFKDLIFYIGKVYGSEYKMPMWFKEFRVSPNGLGEAYHVGVFGKTGSGKSVLAKMILTAYARNKNMTICVLDPQGEYASAFRGDDPAFRTILEDKLGRVVEVHDLQELVLPGHDLFKKVLINSRFFDNFTLPKSYPEIRDRTANIFIRILEGEGIFSHHEKIKPWKYHEDASFNRIWGELQNEEVQKRIYYSSESRRRFVSVLDDLNRDYLKNEWKKICMLFSYENRENAVKLGDLIESAVKKDEEKIILIDLSKERAPSYLYWDDNIQLIVIHAFLEKLEMQAEKEFKNGNKLNTLVVIDEAHRLIPR
ncbi:MAG: helicase HerA domain-containing protein [Candidatus Helarchaeales archaeon]